MLTLCEDQTMRCHDGVLVVAILSLSRCTTASACQADGLGRPGFVDLAAPKAQMNDRLGMVVAGCANTIVALGNREAVIFERSEGQWKATVSIPKPDAEMTFASAAISEGLCLIGAFRAKSKDQPGVVTVHRKVQDQWMHEATLKSPGGKPAGAFGSSVAMHDDLCLVGAPGDDSLAPYSGAVFAFRFVDGTWKPQAKLLPPDGVPHSRFGTHVALGPSRCIVSASRIGEEIRDRRPAGVYSFVERDSEWVYQHRLAFPEGVVPSALVAYPASLNGEWLIIGGGRQGDAGCAMLYRWLDGQWKHAGVLKAPADSGTMYGMTVSMSDTYAGAAIPLVVQQRIGDKWQPVAAEGADIQMHNIDYSMAMVGDAWGTPWADAAGEDSGGVRVFKLSDVGPIPPHGPAQLSKMTIQQLRDRLQEIAAARRVNEGADAALEERLKAEFTDVLKELQKRGAGLAPE